MFGGNKSYLIVASGILIAVSAAMTLYNVWPDKKFAQDRAFFSDDDGKTWYADSIDLIPPYTHNGHPAVRAVIYSYASGSKKFCGYLLRFPDSVKSKIEQTVSSQPGKVTPHGLAYGTETSNQAEVKSPNSSLPWVGLTDPKASTVLHIHSPDGSELDSVLP